MKHKKLKYNAENMFLIINILCKKKNISINKLEKEAGITPGYFSRLNSSRSVPSINIIIKIANYFDITLEEASGNLFASDVIDEMINNKEAEIKSLKEMKEN